jgi:PadR family transcriptional regulator PadR
MCLLSLIREEPSYGYQLARQLQQRGLALIAEGSIYPLLSRLERGGLVEGYLVQSSEGPARKYYRITDLGTRVLPAWIAEWEAFRSGVDQVLKGRAG